MREPWIQTFTGHEFPLLSPQPEDFDIKDIAHALSNICRYTGHCRKFYSVAEHSVRVAYYLEAREPDFKKRAFKAGLLHDATEAYLQDISSPLKRTGIFREYRNVEQFYADLITRRFNAPYHNAPREGWLRDADMAVLVLERARLMGPIKTSWDLPDTLPAPDLSKTPAFLDEWGWEPEIAEQRFLTEARKVRLK